MSEKPLWEGFYEAWADFMSKDKSIEAITNYICSSEGRDALNMDKVNGILSIGAGTGDLEYEMMNLCPNLKKMTLLDPDSHHHRILEERFQRKCQDRIKMKCLNMNFEGYEGPHNAFDIVFCSHVFYYFTDIEHQLDRAFSLVRKGGNLVVIIDQPNQLEPIIVQNASVYNNTHGVYDKLKAFFIKNGLPYIEKKLQNELDLSEPGGIIDIYSNKATSEEEKQRVMDELETRNAFVPGTKSVKMDVSMLILRKE